MNTTKFLVIAVIAHFLSACGGGSSSSGGGEGISVVAVYDGTYQTGLYSGTISFELSSNRQATMSITGVEYAMVRSVVPCRCRDRRPGSPEVRVIEITAASNEGRDGSV